jgi:hypothetical protein
MGKILPFAILPARRDRGTADHTAEIVIFPGVRVEYHDPPPPPPSGRGPARRRARRGPVKGALSA